MTFKKWVLGRIEFMKISVFLGHEPVTILQTVNMFVTACTGQKCTRGCLKSGTHSTTNNKT